MREPGRKRRHDLDALRGFAMLLGVGLHAALAFFPAPWWVQDRTSSFDGPYDEFLWAVHGFRMPVFFLMSGFFTALLWRRRGLRSLLGHRLRRVALPLLIGLVTLVPAVDWVGERAVVAQAEPLVESGDIIGLVFVGDIEGVEGLLDRGVDIETRTEPGGWTSLHAAAFTGNAEMVELLISRGAKPAVTADASDGETPLGLAFHFGHEEATDLLVAHEGRDPLPESMEWSDIPGWAEGAEDPEEDRLTQIEHLHHLWFLWFLLWLVAGFAVVAAIADRREPGRGVWPGRVMWLMIPLTLIPQLEMGGGGSYPIFGSDTSDALLPLPHVLAYYATFFTFGALMYGRRNRKGNLLVETIGRPWWLVLSVSFLVVLPFGLHFTFVEFQWQVASVLQVLYAWGMCFGLMGLFRVLLPRERRGIRYLSDSAYWVYLVHLPLVVAAQMLVFDWDLFAGVKFLLICGVVTAVSLLSYQAFVRYTPIGAMLNGKKVRTARSGASG
ncbi:MAG: acyltransferase family protein [bacterium]|nr:acyltransferase family protein [bacterium]MDE0500354.1 acyltransferase family protein [bacterium]